jgi:hypothetical protein
MKYKAMTTIFTLVLVASFATLVSAASDDRGDHHRNGDLHVTKECSQFTGLDGSFCTITSSNLAAIKVGSKVYYDQAGNTPTGGMDSNAVLDVGPDNWTVGRCTIDGSTGNGLCTFSDGKGQFAGFSARVDVTYTGGVNYSLDGTYSLSPEPRR